MKIVKNNHFQTDSLTQKQAEIFPDFTKDELISYLKGMEDDMYWINVINNSENWKDSYNIGIGIRRIRLDVLYKDNTKKSFYMIVYPAMGC